MNEPHLEAFALAFARCLGCVALAPGFSHQSVPPPLRAGLAFVFALGLAPRFGEAPSLGNVQFLVALATELLLGAAIGFAASILYEAASAAGKLLDTFVGIQIANPLAQVGTGEGFGGLWGIVFVAAFFLLDGYRWVIGALAGSIDSVPLGGTIDAAHWRAFAFATPGLVMRAAALVAGPAIVLGLVAQIGLGSVSRVVPRFMNMTLTFPIVFTAVLLATIATVPFIVRTGGQPWILLPFAH